MSRPFQHPRPRAGTAALRPILLASLASLVALTACSGSGASAGTATGPRSGGTLTFALAFDPTCLDPQQTTLNASFNVSRQLVDSLVDQDPTTGAFKPWLAQSWEVNATATSFTFHLRRDATFSDGTPVDAAAVKANLDGIVKLGARAQLGSGYLAGYLGTTVIDPATARVDFRSPNAQFLQAASTESLGLLSTATLARTADERCRGELAGSGPFVLQHYTPNQDVLISRRGGYAWGSSLWQHTGEAYLDKIEYRIIPESSVRTGSLLSGQVDGISDVQPSDEAQIRGDVTLLVRGNPGIPFNLHPNVTRPVLDDDAVRQAIQKGIDRAEVVQTVLSDRYRPATSMLAATTPGYTDLSRDLAYDPSGARALLDGAGWVPGPDGIRVRAGQRLSIGVVYNTAFNGSQNALELIQQQLKKIGVELRIEQLTVGEQAKLQVSGNYDFLWYNQTRADPDVLRTLFSTKFANRSHLTPGPLDALLDQEAAASDNSRRYQAVGEAQRLIVSNAYAIPVFELSQVHGFSRRVHGVRFNASSRLTFYDTWLQS